MAEKNTGIILQEFGEQLIELGKKQESILQQTTELLNEVSTLHCLLEKLPQSINQAKINHQAALANYQEAVRTGEDTKEKSKSVKIAFRVFDELRIEAEELNNKRADLRQRANDLSALARQVNSRVQELRDPVIRTFVYIMTEHYRPHDVVEIIDESKPEMDRMLERLNSLQKQNE